MSTSPLRAAISGCGAVTRAYYVPAIETLTREGALTLVAAHDPDPQARARLTAAFPHVTAVGSFDDLLAQQPDVVILASPPHHHAEQAIAAVRAGIDVHCEKPLAVSLADGQRMVDGARDAGRRLTVGMVRRHFPATHAIRSLLANGALGRLQSVQCFEGGPFDWPISSAEYFRSHARTGGVLSDIGTHCLDLLLWWLGEPSSVSYADDAMGGVEANCLVELTFGDTRASVRLSRDWARPNRYVFRGTQGWITWTVNEADTFEHGIGATPYAANVVLREARSTPEGPSVGDATADFDRAFADQLRALLPAADCAGRAVEATSVLPTLALVERCYASRRPMEMPWLALGRQAD